MPSAISPLSVAITSSGREIEFPILGYIIYDLVVHGHITGMEYAEMLYWINSYREGGAMPGTRLFRSPLSDEPVKFVYLLDDLLEMWHLANNWADLTDDEENSDPLVGHEDIDLFRHWPVDIGRVCLFPRFNWAE